MESTFIIWSQVITFGTAWSMFHCIFKRKRKIGFLWRGLWYICCYPIMCIR